MTRMALRSDDYQKKIFNLKEATEGRYKIVWGSLDLS